MPNTMTNTSLSLTATFGSLKLPATAVTATRSQSPLTKPRTLQIPTPPPLLPGHTTPPPPPNANSPPCTPRQTADASKVGVGVGVGVGVDVGATSRRGASADSLLKTDFSSHLRASLAHAPADRTGELIRLLDDLAAATHCLSAYMRHGAAASDSASASASAAETVEADVNANVNVDVDVNVQRMRRGRRSANGTTEDTWLNMETRIPSAKEATRHVYETLSHDGYACIILEAGHKAPLTFPDTVPHGSYVVTLCVLDGAVAPRSNATCVYKSNSNSKTTTGPGQSNMDVNVDVGTDVDGGGGAYGTSFSVYRRRSAPSVQGRWDDLRQCVSGQVAAGYVTYGATTHLVYTIGGGAFSFHMHPVAAQYFMFGEGDGAWQLTNKNGGGEDGGDGGRCCCVFADYSGLRGRRRADGVASGMLQFIERKGARLFFNACFVADVDAALLCGGVILWFDVHVLCSAGPMAYIIEQMGGKATNGRGTRILDLCVDDDNVHRTTTFLAGPKELVEQVENCIADAM